MLIEQPLYMSLASLLLNTPASHLFMNWLPDDEVKVHLVALDGSKVGLCCPAQASCGIYEHMLALLLLVLAKLPATR